MRACFAPVPVCVPAGLPEDERLLAAWAHVGVDELVRAVTSAIGRETATVCLARRRVLMLRAARR